MRTRLTADKPYRIAEMLGGRSAEAMLLGLVSHWNTGRPVTLNASEPPTAITDRNAWAQVPGLRERMMHLDTVTYLPDNVLAKTDRASMAVSLEARVPLLDHRVVEFAWRLPMAFKIRSGQTKCVLRRVLYRHVPPHLVDRPKKGFSIPLEPWLRGPLRDWASALLDEGRLQREGYFDPQPITAMWRLHVAGEGNWRFQLWPVLMFQAWKEQWC
jgi:asparagine synthase (glutamine-hydrolysing)